jgi:hypothetical protein
MIVSVFKTMETVMHILFLIVIVPLLLVAAGVVFSVLILLASLALEFSGLLLVALGMGWLIQTLARRGEHKCVPCEQV